MNIEDRRNLSAQENTKLDMDHWKHLIKNRINCQKSDPNCWKKLLP